MPLFSDLRARFQNPKTPNLAEFSEVVFESQPSPSMANFKASESIDDSALVNSSFENEPQPSRAFSSYAKTVGAADGPNQSIFESDPVSSHADFRA